MKSDERREEHRRWVEAGMPKGGLRPLTEAEAKLILLEVDPQGLREYLAEQDNDTRA